VTTIRDLQWQAVYLRDHAAHPGEGVALESARLLDEASRTIELVRRIATYGPGPETTHEQALETIKALIAKRHGVALNPEQP
jgi:hypothetical protein